MNSKKKRPISRRFWSLLKYLPGSVRARLIRSKFEVDCKLPNEITLQMAETPEDIRQALKIVHDSYVELGYMDKEETQLRFSKYLALPGTVILVAKWENEVIGTLSIIPDSAFGLPSDSTVNLNQFRKGGKQIAEISCLSIKKSFRLRRGKLLLPLCKIMYKFCTEVLKLDGIFISTTLEVEPFYTDVLLFEKIQGISGKGHALVKDNPSAYCYLPLGPKTVANYQKIYNKKEKNKNLYRFFVEEVTPNIQMPTTKDCLHSYVVKKNQALGLMVEQDKRLISRFSGSDKAVIKNLDIADILPVEFSAESKFERKSPRPETRLSGICMQAGQENPALVQFVNISREGLQVNLPEHNAQTKIGSLIELVVKLHGKTIRCQAEVRWINWETRLGCSVLNPTTEWKSLVNFLMHEVQEQKVQRNSFQKISGDEAVVLPFAS